MEPGAGTDQAVTRDRTVWRLRLVTCALGLTAVAFWQRPGRVLPDTDVALALDPVGLIRRIWSLWDANTQFGLVRGDGAFVVPAGPFFAAGEAAQLPPWVTQRAWWSLILVVGFLGLVRLAGVLGVRSQPARIVAGLAYTLSPAVLAGLESASVQVWPMAVAPWVLVPVVRGLAGGSPRRCAALSALAVAAAGAASPVATVAVAVPAAIVLVLAPGRLGGALGRLRFAAWWSASVVAATAWWWAPWLLARRYAPADLGLPQVADPVHWATVDAAAAPWPAVGAIGLAVLGLTGLLMRRSPARWAMLATFALGLVPTVAGQPGFGVVVTLPLAIGLAYLTAALRPRRWPERAARATAVTVAGVLLIAMTVPVLAAGPSRAESFEAMPDHWPEAANWLRQHGTTGRALVVPGTSSTVFRWGTTAGEPLAAFAAGPWAVRDGISMPVDEMLEAVERRLATGLGGSAVVDALERAGITHLVIRNDLDRGTTGAPFSLRIYQAIRETPGMAWVGSFGERMGSPATPGVVVDGGLDPVFSAIDVFRVGDSAFETRARLYPLAGAVRLPGGPTSVLPAVEAGALDGRAGFAGGDGLELIADGGSHVVTDGETPVAVAAGRPSTVVLSAPAAPAHDCAPYGQWWRCGPALAAGSAEAASGLNRQVEITGPARYHLSGEVLPGTGPALERLLRPEPGGIRVRASSRSIEAPVGRAQSVADGDPGTSWIAAPGDLRPELQLSWAGERSVRGLDLEYAPDLAASRPSRLLVASGGVSQVVDVGPDGNVRFDRPVRTSRLAVQIVESTPVIDRDSRTGTTTTLPPGISELRVLGADDLVRPVDGAARVTMECGRGPEVVVGTTRVPTRVDGTVADLLAGRPMRMTGCDEGEARWLGIGEHRITVEPTDEVVPLSVTLRPVGDHPGPGLMPGVGIHSWEAAHRVVSVGERAEPAVLVVPENHNPGWEARLDGVVLDQVRHDGWAQAYVVPPGAAGFIVLTYLPEVTYHELLLAGAIALAVIACLAAFPGAGARARSGRPGSDQSAQRRLDVPITEPGERDGDGERRRGEDPEVPGERPDVEESGDHQQGEQVVEEDPVGDVAQPPHRT